MFCQEVSANARVRNDAGLELTDPIGWLLNVGFFAPGASTGAGEALPILKNISTRQTQGRSDD